MVYRAIPPSTSNGKAQGSLEMGPSKMVDEMREAENAVIKHVQRLSFQEVIQALEKIGSSQHSRQAACELMARKTGFFYTFSHHVIYHVNITKHMKYALSFLEQSFELLQCES